jgi:hypothetical protein
VITLLFSPSLIYLLFYDISWHQSRHLPTARIPPSTPHPFILTLTHFFPKRIRCFVHLHHQRLLPLVFEFCRLLSIVPAVLGTMWNLYSMVWLPCSAGGDGDVGGGWGRRSTPERLDFFVAALWVCPLLFID